MIKWKKNYNYELVPNIISENFSNDIKLYTEIPGNDRHVYQYPDERVIPEDYEAEVYEDDEHDEKSNRVPDRANKWYANDDKVVPANAATAPSTTIVIFVTVLKTLVFYL